MLDITNSSTHITHYQQPLVVFVIGASGDLARKKTYPALYELWSQNLLPAHCTIWGFARTKKTHEQLRSSLRPNLLKTAKDENNVEDQVDAFLNCCFYQNGKSYGDWVVMHQILSSCGSSMHNLLVYLAIPPHVFGESTQALKMALKDLQAAVPGFLRVILEKPFGRDTETCRALLNTLQQQKWQESELYRIDHYLGKEMVQNILALRTSNPWLKHLWNRDVIHSVHLVFKEPFGTEGRGGYFDGIGIIRDICQNHLLQVLTLIAMELPEKLTASAIRDAKVEVLKNMPVLSPEDVLHGQYIGYKDDDTIENLETTTPTYVCMRSWVNTPTWEGVPFVLEAGKALDERVCEARLFFRGQGMNALVLRLQPQPAIFLTTNMKTPGFSEKPVSTHMGVDYGDSKIPDAYTRLLLDVLRGQQANFVRDDELVAAWEIFTPLLDQLEHVPPLLYEKGSTGPKEREDYLRAIEVAAPGLPPPAAL